MNAGSGADVFRATVTGIISCRAFVLSIAPSTYVSHISGGWAQAQDLINSMVHSILVRLRD